MDIAALAARVAKAAPMPFCEVRAYNRYVTAHVDGDYMAYFAAGNDDCSAGDARRNVLSRLSKLRTVSGAGRVVMHLTHGSSTKGDRFLAAVTQPYQAQRKGSRKPRHWAFLREWMEQYEGAEFEPKIWTTREADDGMAHVCYSVAQHQNILHVVHTRDKDMRMFCGVHVNWMDYSITEVPKDAFDVVGQDDQQYGHKWFWYQMLTGDQADHIPGLPGVGPVAASTILQGCDGNHSAFLAVSSAYRAKKGDGWADYFVEQAALLWMRTDRYATTRNFLTLGVFNTEIHNAVLRLEERVRKERAKLEALKT